MKKETETRYLQIPTTGVIFFSILLVAVSFFAGFSYVKLKSTGTVAVPTTAATAIFAASKTNKPELKFFVMSFCPYGNQMEDSLRPVFDLLGSKVDITPHYIFEKVTDLNSFCATSSGDITKCSTYVTSGYFKTEAECKTTITADVTKCKDETGYIKAGNAFYASLHGRQEATQDVREICAWNQTTDKKQWWDFVGNVNKNCTAQNADSCWTEQAQKAGLDATKITECFNTQAVNLIEKEIAATTQYKVQGSPTVLINDVVFPPESAYTQDGKGTLKIGDKVATQDQFRSPNVIKTAICASFNKSPNECKTALKDLTGAAPAAGACGN
ncbi:MAG: hypothetical protein NTY75_02210 [Candidatus Shapirobacteria bacterium]|nr:hypothetical protein [Candidatus Shapirobacteria bacterium]